MTQQARMRLDVWLWRARFFKSRSLAAEAVETCGARIEHDGLVRRIERPAALVGPGDVICFTTPHCIETVRILDLPGRRGPADEAERCYVRSLTPAGDPPAPGDRP